MIRDDQERVQQLDRLSQSTTARAVIVHVDSPGGTTAGSEQLYDASDAVEGAKAAGRLWSTGWPPRAVTSPRLAGDHIVAKQTSLVGSIGVLFQYPNVSDLLDKLGVKVESIKSSPLKAAPNGFEPTSPEARAAIESIIKDSYAWFRGLVQDRRHLNDDELQTVADGRVFTGHQGIGLKLVDELGDERTGIAWLAKEKNINSQTAGAAIIELHRPLQRPAVPARGRCRSAGCRRLRHSSPAAFTSGARCRRSNGSILTVYWPFGTLPARTEVARQVAMIKSELVQRISAQNPHLYQRDVEKIVNAILGEIIAAMARGDRVELRGFGAFSVKQRPARTGRNPRTGAHVAVDQKCVPFFKTGKEMRERLNQVDRSLIRSF